MKIDNMAILRDTLEQIETPELDAMLLEELRKETPNGDLIRLLGSILKERDKATIPEIDANVQQAWEKYQRKTKPVHKKPKHTNSLLLKVASFVLMLLALVTLLPQEAHAMNFFERFIAWTEDVFSLISPAEAQNREVEYVFQTDNPGLQEVYDKVTELGVTVPVVPMWLPEKYKLVESKAESNLVKTCVTALFANGNADLVYQLIIYSDNVSSEYYKDDSLVQECEINDTNFRILNNEDLQVVIWTKENIECTIAIDCQENEVYRILESIYTMEE